MARKLFCEISPVTYKISVWKGIAARNCRDLVSGEKFAKAKSEQPLPVCLYRHRSLIRRRLGNVNMKLQENKAVNLALAAPRVTNIVIRPGETFSFWRLVGNTTARKGYKEGLTIEKGQPKSGLGGGMCQFTNLLHWMVLHTSLTITEHHHHDRMDLFPDHNRQIPFGTGTSIMYNYLDYRVKNGTGNTYQFITWVTDEYLCGEVRALRAEPYRWHIHAENEYFSREGENVYRNGTVVRETVDPVTGNRCGREVIRTNHAKVMYDTAGLEIRQETASAEG